MNLVDEVRAVYGLEPNDRVTIAQRQARMRKRRAYDRNFAGLNRYLVENSPTFTDYIEVANQAYDQLLDAGFEQRTFYGRRPSSANPLNAFDDMV